MVAEPRHNTKHMRYTRIPA